MRMTEKQYSMLMANKVMEANTRSGEAVGKNAKYNNTKVFYDGYMFDSIKERNRYQTLWLMQRANIISDLQLQVPFVLEESVQLKGRKKPAIRYFADFTYTIVETQEFVVEDVKSVATKNLPVYRHKIHLLKARHNIEVKEV